MEHFCRLRLFWWGVITIAGSRYRCGLIYQNGTYEWNEWRVSFLGFSVLLWFILLRLLTSFCFLYQTLIHFTRYCIWIFKLGLIVLAWDSTKTTLARQLQLRDTKRKEDCYEDESTKCASIWHCHLLFAEWDSIGSHLGYHIRQWVFITLLSSLWESNHVQPQ